MTDKPKNMLFGLLPAICGIVSLIPPILFYAILWVMFNEGPAGGPISQNPLALAAPFLLPLCGFVCGVVGIKAGISRKKWIGVVIAALGTILNGFMLSTLLLGLLITR